MRAIGYVLHLGCTNSPILLNITEIVKSINNIFTCMSVTIDGVWIGNWIYCTLTDRNYT
jgi:hypothetical protein